MFLEMIRGKNQNLAEEKYALTKIVLWKLCGWSADIKAETLQPAELEG